MLDELIDELILMTRLDTGLSDPRFDPVDLVAVAAEECARYRDCTLSGASGDVLGDRRMIKHMLRNLVDNAHAHGEPPVDVKIGREGDSVVLTVSDSGPGIPDSEREKVFQPFYPAVTKLSVRWGKRRRGGPSGGSFVARRGDAAELAAGAPCACARRAQTARLVAFSLSRLKIAEGSGMSGSTWILK